MWKGENRITRTTPTCFFTTFVIACGEIFLEYFWNILEKSLKKFQDFLHAILLRFMLKICQKCHFQKN
jgi:hypothetical protein